MANGNWKMENCMLDIVPTILTNDPRELEEKISHFEDIQVTRVHIDITDGEFVDGKTIPLEALENIETEIMLDIHLMVAEPSLWVEHAIRASAERIIGQIEQMRSQSEFVGKVTEASLDVGLALDVETSVSSIDSQVLHDLDVVLVMGRKAGFEEHEFKENALGKVGELSETRGRMGAHFRILVDGGVNRDNMVEIEEAGADEVCVGHSFEQLWSKTSRS